MSILIVGGAGYIGSHVAQYFIDNNEKIITLDNLQSGHKQAVISDKFYHLDIRDVDSLDKVFRENDIEAVIHLAANSLVGESIKNPYEYYHNNVYGMMCLLNSMKNHKVNKIVFSSSAAVYGEPKSIPILETDDTSPTNTYGETKLTMEKMMKWFEKAYGIKYVSLRYFNAAGAHENGHLGEDHNPETHLIPLVLQVALGNRDCINIFGDNYPTKDGTCIRDYVHVMDLASAHYLALEYLRKNNASDIFNLGNGNGYSVREVIECARMVTGNKIPEKISSRRDGDPAVLVASSDKAKLTLGWKPEDTQLIKIISDAWNFYKKHPNGYEI